MLQEDWGLKILLLETRLTLPKSPSIRMETAAMAEAREVSAVTFSLCKPAKLKMPLVVLSYDLFFSTGDYDASAFNAWFRRHSWHAPVHIYALVHFLGWPIVNGLFFGIAVHFIPDQRVKHAAIAVLAVLALVQLLATFACTLVETMDPLVRKARRPRNTSYVKVSHFTPHLPLK
jgi:hypothetical protein